MTDIIHKSIRLPALGFDLPCDGPQDVCELFTKWLRDRVGARLVDLAMAMANPAFNPLAQLLSEKAVDALGTLLTDVYLTGANDALMGELVEGIHVIPEDQRVSEDPMAFVKALMSAVLGIPVDNINVHPGVQGDLDRIMLGEGIEDGIVPLSGDSADAYDTVDDAPIDSTDDDAFGENARMTGEGGNDAGPDAAAG